MNTLGVSENEYPWGGLNFIYLWYMPARKFIIACMFLSAIVLLNPMHVRCQLNSIKVLSETRHQFEFPWAGGMNSCQFGSLDIDRDGTKDLIVYDRVGDRLLPFITVADGGSYNYAFAPQYAENFPALSHWAIFTDYNLDGEADIFTFSPSYAGMKVYRNVSGSNLEFKLEVYPYLTSFQGGGYVNILVTYADYPAISDLDGDGDLDILTFYGLGSFVEKHRNMSMEKYGNADSLDFIKTDYCWGYFAESDESNIISLDTCLRCNVIPARQLAGSNLPTADRHTGSTFQVLDLNNDQLPDLLLGDVDYPNLIALYNGGTPDTARMTSYDWQYPPGENAVDLFAMPAAFCNDFDFDGINEMLVSPFDPNPFQTENFNSVWFYDNYGSSEVPQFTLESKSFLQDQMLDFGAGAYPMFVDVDLDGLQDLIVGNYGYYDSSYFDEFSILHTLQTGKLAYLKNTGTLTQPAFALIDLDFAGTSMLNHKGIVPTFGDLDGDGDDDLVVGCEFGDMVVFGNIAEPGEPMLLTLGLNGENSLFIDVGAYSAPQIFDLDGDSLLDLIIGEKGGNLNYYRNTGSAQSPFYTFITDSLGKINVTNYNVSLDGYSVPYFFRDETGNTHLVVGSEQGEIFYFTNIDGNLDGEFKYSANLNQVLGLPVFNADRGYRTSAVVTDLDNDDYPELIAGNFSGGLEYFGKNGASPVSGTDGFIPEGLMDIRIYPNPASDYITVSCKNCPDGGHFEFKIIDPLGEIMYSSPGNFKDELTLAVDNYPPGIYLLLVYGTNDLSGQGYRFSKKIVIF
jgi:hypothetical protein